jgi:hypothetical protein
MAIAFNKEAGAAVLRCSEPVDFSYRGGGKFYAHDPALGFARELEFHVLAKTFQNLALVLQQHYAAHESGGAEVIQFPGRAA